MSQTPFFFLNQSVEKRAAGLGSLRNPLIGAGLGAGAGGLLHAYRRAQMDEEEKERAGSGTGSLLASVLGGGALGAGAGAATNLLGGRGDGINTGDYSPLTRFPGMPEGLQGGSNIPRRPASVPEVDIDSVIEEATRITPGTLARGSHTTGGPMDYSGSPAAVSQRAAMAEKALEEQILQANRDYAPDRDLGTSPDLDRYGNPVLKRQNKGLTTPDVVGSRMKYKDTPLLTDGISSTDGERTMPHGYQVLSSFDKLMDRIGGRDVADGPLTDGAPTPDVSQLLPALLGGDGGGLSRSPSAVAGIPDISQIFPGMSGRGVGDGNQLDPQRRMELLQQLMGSAEGPR